MDRFQSELIKKVGLGDRKAFEELYKGVYPRIYRYFYRMLGDEEMARELGNEVMMEVWRGASSFRGDSRVLTWIWSIARRKVWKAFKNNRMEQVSLEEWDGAHEDYAPHHMAHLRDLKEKMAMAMDGLTPKHKEVIHMAYYQGFSLEEMSELLGVPVNTVKTRMFYARKKLRQLLEGLGVEHGQGA